MGSPARQKRLGLSFFCLILSGFMVSGCVHFCQKWQQVVCDSEWVSDSEAKLLDSFGKFDVFETEVSTTFSLELQRKVVLLDILPLLIY